MVVNSQKITGDRPICILLICIYPGYGDAEFPEVLLREAKTFKLFNLKSCNYCVHVCDL